MFGTCKAFPNAPGLCSGLGGVTAIPSLPALHLHKILFAVLQAEGVNSYNSCGLRKLCRCPERVSDLWDGSFPRTGTCWSLRSALHIRAGILVCLPCTSGASRERGRSWASPCLPPVLVGRVWSSIWEASPNAVTKKGRLKDKWRFILKSRQAYEACCRQIFCL